MKKNAKKVKMSIILTSVLGVGLLLSSAIAPTVIFSIAKPIYFNQDWRPNPSYQRIQVSSSDRNEQNMNKIVSNLTFDQIENDLMFSTFVWAHKFVDVSHEAFQEWSVKLLNIKWKNSRLSYQVEINYPDFDNWESELPGVDPYFHRKVIINVSNAELFFEPSATLNNNDSPLISNSVFSIRNGTINVKEHHIDMKTLSISWKVVSQWKISDCSFDKLYSYTIDSEL